MEKKTGSSEAEVPRGWCLWCSTKLKTHKPIFREHYGEDDGRPSDGHPLHTPERCREVLARLREALIDVNAHLAIECAALRANLTSVQARGTQLVEELRKAREELARTDHLRQLSAAEVNAVRREQQAVRPSGRGVDFPCEECKALQGATLKDGWWRCNACGYPSK